MIDPVTPEELEVILTRHYGMLHPDWFDGAYMACQGCRGAPRWPCLVYRLALALWGARNGN